MRVAIAQISDLHLKESAVAVEQADLVAHAMLPYLHGCEHCLLVFSGDIAFSGAVEEYILATDFIVRITEVLRKEFNEIPVTVCAVPGNHDCDFSSLSSTRDQLRDSILRDKPPAPAKDVQDVCTSIQDNFFAFRDVVEGKHLPTTDSRLSYQYRVPLSSNTDLMILGLNTAWLSTLHEEPASLLFPTGLIPERDSSQLVVSVLHHPYNWLQPRNARELRRRLEGVSDIILTGHEHDPDTRRIGGDGGERTLYLEAPALNSPDGSPSGFQIVVVDLADRRQKLVRMRKDRDRYDAVLDSPWEEYQVGRLRQAEQFHLSAEMEGFVADLGVSLAHAHRGKLERQDVFVYPDIREISYVSNQTKPVTRGESVVELLNDLRRIVIVGVEQSGKTALAKQVFCDLLDGHSVPLFIRGPLLKKLDSDHLIGELGREFDWQYQPESRTAYLQLPKDRRAIIIDDFHLSHLRGDALQAVLSSLYEFATRIVLFASEPNHVLDIVRTDTRSHQSWRYSHFRMLPFGHARRNELLEKWFGLDPKAVSDEEEFARLVVHTKAAIDTAIGKDFVPAYPVFILPLLQARTYNDQVDIHASTYGYYYELLIRRSLAEGSSREVFDVKLTYLTNLAYYMFARKVSDLSDRELREYHARYETEKLIEINFARLQAELIKAGVLEENQDRYCFKYSYYYYYFVANFLRDHIAEPPVRLEIASLAKDLHHEESANILLFLAHLSRDPYIVEQMIETARSVYSDNPRSEMRPDESPLGAIDDAVAVYVDRGSAARNELMERTDQREAVQLAPAEVETDDIDEELAKLFAAFKTLQILGQLLKNFPGSMSGETKSQLLSECIGIGLRTMSMYFHAAAESKEALVAQIGEMLKDVDPDLNEEELARKTRQSVFAIIHRGSYGMIKRMSVAVGGQSLFPVYEAVLGVDETIAKRLVHLSLHLDQAGAFPESRVIDLNAELEGNQLAAAALRTLVINHFHLFNVRFDVKQRICAHLSIRYERLVGGDQGRLLPRRSVKDGRAPKRIGRG